MAETGLQMYESGNYEGALELFNTVVDAEPDNPLAYDVRGSIYTALHDYLSALDNYSTAIELNPSFAQAYYNRGRVYSFLERYGEALSDLERSVELEPQNFGYRAKGNVGLIYHQLGEYENALEAFETSMAYEDSKADIFYYRGETYTALENYEAAIADYGAAIERFSGYDLAYQGLGYAYYKTSQLDQAAEALNQALEISPDSPAARLYLGLVHLTKDDAESANAEVSQAASSLSSLSKEEQEFVYSRVVADLEAFAQENPAKAAEAQSMIDLIPEP
jgi:tetratricopeptide (TPR) repeat protein